MYKSFKDMPIWEEAMRIAEEIFNLKENLPKKEEYGFTSQIRRSALSISANIAEAFGRHHKADKMNFYYIARSSITETQSHLEYGKRVKYINESSAKELNDLLNRLYSDINKIIKSMRNSNAKK